MTCVKNPLSSCFSHTRWCSDKPHMGSNPISRCVFFFFHTRCALIGCMRCLSLTCSSWALHHQHACVVCQQVSRSLPTSPRILQAALLLSRSSVQTKERNKSNGCRRTLMKLTNKADIEDQVQLLSSVPPSLTLDPVDVKAGSSTKGPVWSRGVLISRVKTRTTQSLILGF